MAMLPSPLNRHRQIHVANLVQHLYIYIYMVHAVVTLDYYSAVWLRLKKRKSRKMIGTVEVEKKKIWIGKIEAKKKSLVKCILFPLFRSNLATLEVPGHTKSQPAQHRKSLGLTYIGPDELRWRLQFTMSVY